MINRSFESLKLFMQKKKMHKNLCMLVLTSKRRKTKNFKFSPYLSDFALRALEMQQEALKPRKDAVQLAMGSTYQLKYVKKHNRTNLS